jgi:hypothetical protein
MTEPSKYEEAAKAHFDAIGRPDDGNEMRAWIAGAEHASKEAHNEAIDKALSLIMEANHDYPIHHIYEAIENLKI